MENVRLIHSVDKVSNLRTLVKQDLKELGIKVPKNKKTKKLNQSRNTSQDGLLTSGIFGNYLSFVPGTYIPDCGFVPTFLVDAAEIIEENCWVEGIFRKSGSINRQKELRQQIEEGEELKSASVHDVTVLIKQFFRELPEPLLTSVFHDCFVRCYHLPSPNQVEAMLLLCLLLPIEHLSTLRFTMGLLSRLAKHSGHNKMDEGNLAVVLAPNIMHVNSRSQKMNATEEKLLQLQTAIVELLIHNADRLGVVSESLYQRTALMTECFGTEDELDASDDNTLEDSKDAKEVRKKRRKRSSSLQGLVSSIGRGIAKLRRSTDGKNNLTSTSQMSASNESGMTAQSQSQSLSKTQEMSLPPADVSATPVVIRKRKASGEGVPFSATKKKAILEQLPQRSALGATPFTPASARRPLSHDPRIPNPMDTPSIAFTGKSQMEFSATPSHEMKNPRKKLGLFSPASNRKNKRRKSSTTNLCSNPLRKSGKAKHLFKRLSGSKERDFLDPHQREDMVGERLSSPTGVAHSDSAAELGNTEGVSPVASLALVRSTSSPSLHNTSLVSSGSVPNALDQGFIDPDDTVDLDATRSSALASLAPTTPQTGQQQRGRTLARTDSCRLSQRPVRRSHSTDGSLRRGQPNTVGNGLLEGKAEKLSKLRRSFDKSDIGYPIPVIVPTLPEKMLESVDKKCRDRHEDRASKSHDNDASKPHYKTSDRSLLENPREQSVLESSLMNIVLPPPSGFNDQTMMETGGEGGSDTESDSGFSTISGGTVIHNPPQKFSTLDSLRADFGAGPRSMACYGSSVSVNMPPPPPLQPSASVDSLLSSASEWSAASNSEQGKAMERSFSVDSGKGSLMDSVDTSKKQREERKLNTTFTKSPSEISKTSVLMTDDSKPVSSGSSRSIKSVSAEDLSSRMKVERPAARSNSMYVASSGRHCNMIPNLQICADTHRLLARAGFLEHTDLPPNVKDVSLPARSPKKSTSQSFHFSRNDQRGISFRHDQSVLSRKSSSSEDVRERNSRRMLAAEGEKTAKDALESVSRVLEPMEEEVAETLEEKGKAENAVESQHQSGSSHHPVLALKHAELRMQKHESISQIKETNAGRVAANVHQINSSLERSGLDQSDASLHFPKCTTRKRGVSPIRIPTIFANSDKKAEYYRNLAQKACRRLDNTKNSDDDASHTDPPSASKDSKEHLQVPGQRFLFTEQESELSNSLLETIDDVITPRSKKHHSQTKRSPLQESTNTKLAETGHAANEEGKQHHLRTAKGLTPHQILRYGPATVGSKRSPAKPVKRLQSPHSPHSRLSPHRYPRSPEKSTEALRLSSRPNQTYEQY